MLFLFSLFAFLMFVWGVYLWADVYHGTNIYSKDWSKAQTTTYLIIQPVLFGFCLIGSMLLFLMGLGVIK